MKDMCQKIQWEEMEALASLTSQLFFQELLFYSNAV